MTHPNPRYAELLIDRQGLKLAAVLNQGLTGLDHETAERLRAARERALAHRKVAVTRPAPLWAPAGQAAVLGWSGDDGMGWLGRLSVAVALGVLVLGLLGINDLQNRERARELADVDVALLTDDLPPAAFADPGFVKFLQKDL